jgi:hypothetical protein
MSSMGTNIAQSVAGAQQAQQAAAAKPPRPDAARERKAIRTGDQVELSTELIDAVHDAANANDEQPRQQQHHQPEPKPGDEAPPHIDLQA